ncbi:MAG: DUF1801 domain-containing protein [Bacteroidota bacterium]
MAVKSGQSPRQTISVEKYLEEFPKDIQAIASKVRALILRAFPDVLERVYPGWKLVGYRVLQDSKSYYFGFVAPFADKVVLGFEYGRLLSDSHQILKGKGTQVRHITFAKASQIKPNILVPMILEAASIAMKKKL